MVTLERLGIPRLIEKSLDVEVTMYDQWGNPFTITPRIAISRGAEVRCHRCHVPLGVLDIVQNIDHCEDCVFVIEGERDAYYEMNNADWEVA